MEDLPRPARTASSLRFRKPTAFYVIDNGQTWVLKGRLRLERDGQPVHASRVSVNGATASSKAEDGVLSFGVDVARGARLVIAAQAGEDRAEITATCPGDFTLIIPASTCGGVPSIDHLDLGWDRWPLNASALSVVLVPFDVRDPWFSRADRLLSFPWTPHLLVTEGMDLARPAPGESWFSDGADGVKLLRANVATTYGGTWMGSAPPPRGPDGWLLEVTASGPPATAPNTFECRVSRRIVLSQLHR